MNGPGIFTTRPTYLGWSMLDKEAEDAVERFMIKLKGKGFKMARSQNNAEDYSDKKQTRDSKAVEEFVQTDIFKDIMKLSS